MNLTDFNFMPFKCGYLPRTLVHKGFSPFAIDPTAHTSVVQPASQHTSIYFTSIWNPITVASSDPLPSSMCKLSKIPGLWRLGPQSGSLRFGTSAVYGVWDTDPKCPDDLGHQFQVSRWSGTQTSSVSWSRTLALGDRCVSERAHQV